MSGKNIFCVFWKEGGKTYVMLYLFDEQQFSVSESEVGEYVQIYCELLSVLSPVIYKER